MSAMSDLISEFGFRLGIKSVFEACIFTIADILVLWLLVWAYMLIRLPQSAAKAASLSLVSCRTYYLPYSVGTLTGYSTMSIFWSIRLVGEDQKVTYRHKTVSLRNALSWIYINQKIFAGLSSSDKNIDTVTHFDQSNRLRPTQNSRDASFQMCQPTICVVCMNSKASLWSTMRGCPHHEYIYQIERRSKVIWSMLRIVNIALLTDPFTLFEIYVTGRTLYLYRVSFCSSIHNEDNRVFTRREDNVEQNIDTLFFLLPCNIEELLENAMGEHDHSNTSYELVDTVDSTDVLWKLLMQCG